MLHQGDNRDLPRSKAVWETEAEAVAFVVTRGIGLENPAAGDYIQLYQGNRDLLLTGKVLMVF